MFQSGNYTIATHMASRYQPKLANERYRIPDQTTMLTSMVARKSAIRYLAALFNLLRMLEIVNMLTVKILCTCSYSILSHIICRAITFYNRTLKFFVLAAIETRSCDHKIIYHTLLNTK